ncbi:hypothetical protein GCM10010468_30500 [Actinocorallia longicatena]|uniref:Uncharacterized protein n=1 Tax=Actinocorallia longicatena TaxID=111803 RepID=A0ABP6QEJ1_9ACTN
MRSVTDTDAWPDRPAMYFFRLLARLVSRLVSMFVAVTRPASPSAACAATGATATAAASDNAVIRGNLMPDSLLGAD